MGSLVLSTWRTKPKGSSQAAREGGSRDDDDK
jgi:hypothetical protein